MSSQMLNFFLSHEGVRLDDAKDGEPSLIWKAVLRTGTWKLRPGPGGVKLKEPLKVYRDKAPKGHISMADLVKSFDAQAKENVTLTVAHADGTTADVGFVRKLVIQDVAGEDGSKEKQSLLWAGMDVTDSVTKTKVDEKTYVGCSGGILFDYERTEDAKKFGQILSHVMITNSPWINGTGDFKSKLPDGVMAAESDDLPVGELEFDNTSPDPVADPAKKPQPPSGSVVWRPEDGYQHTRRSVQKALDGWRRALLVNRISPDYEVEYPYFHCEDISGAADSRKALITSGYGSESDSWVAGVKFDTDGTAEIEPFMNWTPAKQEWVAASQDPNPAPPKPAPASSAGRTSTKPNGHGLSGSHLVGFSLREAQDARTERSSLGQTQPNPGGTMSLMDTLAGVDLSDDQREAIRKADEAQAREAAELKSLRETKRQADVSVYLSQLATKLGLEPPEGETDAAKSLPPATARYVRSVLMSDDGGPAIELSELTDTGSRTTPVPKTASDILKGFIDALPQDDQGRVSLAQQARKLPGDEPPPKKGPEDEDKNLSAKEKADLWLEETRAKGIPVDIPMSASQNGGK